MSTELSRVSNEISVFVNDKLSIFKDTPLAGASQLFIYAMSFSNNKNRPLIMNFFQEIHHLYVRYETVLRENRDIQQELDQKSNTLVLNDPIPIEDQQSDIPFREFLLQHSNFFEVQDVLKRIVGYNKSTVSAFIKDQYERPGWENFVDMLMDIKRNALNSTRTYQSRVVKFIQQAFEENYALRSDDIEEVVQNIIKDRELVNTN